MQWIKLLLLSTLLTACATTPQNNQAITKHKHQATPSQLFKSDFNRVLELEWLENKQSLKTLMLKLYKRNPNQLAKSTSDNAEAMVDWVFEGATEHQWQFNSINNIQGPAAIRLAFAKAYQGDRVLPFIVGIVTMYQQVHGNKEAFYFTDNIDPQSLYNVARNVEIAMWKLAHEHDENGNLYLLSNAMQADKSNLSFEREFGKIIGRTELSAYMLAEKSERTITRIAQSLATSVFLPF